MDDEFDDAALWAVIDSAAASYTSSTVTATATTAISKYRRPHPHPHPPLNLKTPLPKPLLATTTSPSSSLTKTKVSSYDTRASKVSRTSPYSTPPQFNISSPEAVIEYKNCGDYSNNNVRHCLAGQFPSVSLFKDYQDAAMSILEKSDYSVISGNPFIKKSGWRKIAFYFNVSFEIRDKSIEFDENRNVVRAEFVARAYMQGGRFSDGWGSCERREKKFSKPNHDIPSTAETRAKNRACQDLLGIGQYRPGVHHSNPQRSH